MEELTQKPVANDHAEWTHPEQRPPTTARLSNLRFPMSRALLWDRSPIGPAVSVHAESQVMKP